MLNELATQPKLPSQLRPTQCRHIQNKTDEKCSVIADQKQRHTLPADDDDADDGDGDAYGKC